ncbi:MAG: ADP-ribosylation factor-like protein [Promethearchaeota archaeon]|jgi:GTPase SAR1 family protein
MRNQNDIDSSKRLIKILLIGLDNGGKTSILKCLKGIKGLSAFNSQDPTKGLEIERFKALDSKYAIWDLGGQKAYQEDYFNDMENILKGTKKVIYVFDVQDVKRYKVALEYLKKFINVRDKLKNVDFSIFLHKYDPDLQFDQSLNKFIIDELITKIKELIPQDFIYSIHKTSIYAVFEKNTIT